MQVDRDFSLPLAGFFRRVNDLTTAYLAADQQHGL